MNSGEGERQSAEIDVIAKWLAARLMDRTSGGLCSQCGEQPGVMLKIGTPDLWCAACLDEAADTPRRDEALRAVLDRLAAVTAQRDQYAAQVARVEAVLAIWEQSLAHYRETHIRDCRISLGMVVDRLRAALRTDEGGGQ